MADLLPLLSRLSIFKQASEPDLKGLAAVAIERSVPGNTLLFEEGSPADGLFVVASGKVQIWKKAFDGTPQHVATLGVGESIGEMSLFDGAPRSAMAKTAEPTTLVVFPSAAFHQVLVDHSAFGVQFLMRTVRQLTARLRKTSQELADVVSLSVSDLS